MSQTKQGPSNDRQQPRPTNLPPGVIWGVVGLVALIAALAVFRVDTWGDRGSGLSPRFEFDVSELAAVDPALVSHAETAQIPVGMQTVQAIAAKPDGGFLVAGDRAVQMFQADGTMAQAFSVPDAPRSLAVAGEDHDFPGRIYVGMASRVEVFDASGQPIASWSEGLNQDSLLTSLAVFEENVLAADAGNRVVVRWDASGRLLGTIGQPDDRRGIDGFVIPSEFFDLVVPQDGILRVVNPGALRVEAFTLDGDPLGHWGEASARIEGFFGCCNPSHLTVLADGRFVTSEKGLPRIKLYSPRGEFESVIAATASLTARGGGQEIRDEHSPRAFDVAADATGRVLVLDPNTRQVRIFEPLESGAMADAG